MDITQTDADSRNVKMNVPKPLQAHYQRTGLLAGAEGTWVPEVGYFALLPRYPGAPKGSKRRRKRVNVPRGARHD
jgi:hypothetical protein